MLRMFMILRENYIAHLQMLLQEKYEVSLRPESAEDLKNYEQIEHILIE